jgi:hypothetical protein
LITHCGALAVDTVTLRAAVWRLPDSFLTGIGLNSAEVGALRELYR